MRLDETRPPPRRPDIKAVCAVGLGLGGCPWFDLLKLCEGCVELGLGAARKDDARAFMCES